MIVAVEGPSAAGKTSWCRQHASAFIPEYAPTGVEPDETDAAYQAAYWVGVNSGRWRAALDLEARSGTAICDSDPLKLLYSWCLSRVGAAPWSRFEREFAQARHAFASGSLGFADLVLISVPATAILRGRRDADTSRRRRTFALHSTLAEPLRSWYEAVEALEPGRVFWVSLPMDCRGLLQGHALDARTQHSSINSCTSCRVTRRSASETASNRSVSILAHVRCGAPVELGGKTATRIEVPHDVVAALEKSKRPAVRMKGGDHTYRTIASMGGRFLVPLNAGNRAAARVSAGDYVQVDIDNDDADELRGVSVPSDLAAVLGRDLKAQAFFDQLGYTPRQEWVRRVEGAKQVETRATRISKTVSSLRASSSLGMRSAWEEYSLKLPTGSLRYLKKLEPLRGRPRPQTCRSGLPSSIALAPRIEASQPALIRWRSGPRPRRANCPTRR